MKYDMTWQKKRNYTKKPQRSEERKANFWLANGITHACAPDGHVGYVGYFDDCDHTHTKPLCNNFEIFTFQSLKYHFADCLKRPKQQTLSTV
jgi:hypothetical protein